MTPKRLRRYWCPRCKTVIVRMGRKTHLSYCERSGRDVVMRQLGAPQGISVSGCRLVKSSESRLGGKEELWRANQPSWRRWGRRPGDPRRPDHLDVRWRDRVPVQASSSLKTLCPRLQTGDRWLFLIFPRSRKHTSTLKRYGFVAMNGMVHVRVNGIGFPRGRPVEIPKPNW